MNNIFLLNYLNATASFNHRTTCISINAKELSSESTTNYQWSVQIELIVANCNLLVHSTSLSLSHLHTIKMKIFQLIRKSFETMGISPHQSNQIYPLNARVLLAIVTAISFTAFACASTFRVASILKENIDLVYLVFTLIVNTVYYVVFTWRKSFFFDSIDKIEITIQQSV